MLRGYEPWGTAALYLEEDVTKTLVADDDYTEDKKPSIWEAIAHAQGRCSCYSIPSNVIYHSFPEQAKTFSNGQTMTFSYTYTSAIS